MSVLYIIYSYIYYFFKGFKLLFLLINLTQMQNLNIPECNISVDTPKRDKLFKDGVRSAVRGNILGQGSYGTVIKAVYKGKAVAAKLLEGKKLQTLQNESNVLGWKHENIVEVIKIVTNPNYGIVIMEMFSGLCLQHVIDQIQLSLYHRFRIVLDTLSGLCYCHEKKIVHLDIKPLNILIAFEGDLEYHQNKVGYKCKLCDFGSSIKLGNKDNLTNSTKGTVSYMPPEVFLNSYITTSVDIFSLGITMWQLKSGQYPYAALESNNAIVYRVVKENLRPDDISLRHLKLTTANHNCLCSPFNITHSNRSIEDIQLILSSTLENQKYFSLKSLNKSHKQNNQKLVINKKLKFKNANEGYSQKLQRISPSVRIITADEGNLVTDITKEPKIKSSLKNIFNDPGKDVKLEQKESQYILLYKQCWERDPSKRPKAHTLCQVIASLMIEYFSEKPAA